MHKAPTKKVTGLMAIIIMFQNKLKRKENRKPNKQGKNAKIKTNCKSYSFN